ncbi:MAG: M48 family metallopeptidase [Actinomycetota bacterium]
MSRGAFWLAAGVMAAVAAVLAVGLEKERRADGGAQGALISDGWRIRLAAAPLAEEMADQQYRASMQDYAAAGLLDRDPYFTELVGSVAEPLIAAAKDLYPQTRDWPWEWHLADVADANAYCMAGGRMVVLSGLLNEQMLGDDRDMLATILAHEVAHAILQHSRENFGRAMVAQGLAWTMAKSLKIGALREQEMVKDLKTALLDPKTRAREAEADVLGLELMARAGFDPAKAVDTWEHMANRLSEDARQARVQRALAFLSDHPSDMDRLERMKALQPKAKPLAGKGKRWQWAVDGIDDRQAQLLVDASAAFGIGAQRLSFTDRSPPVRRVAQATGLPPDKVVAMMYDAAEEAGLDQGGALVMGLRAMLRGAGGWERLDRITQAWSRVAAGRSLPQDPAVIRRLPLSDEDRAYAAQAAERVEAYMGSELVARRMWRGLVAELARRHPKAADALVTGNDGRSQ